MSEQIVSRERIALLAEAAAGQVHRTGLPPLCPYPEMSDAAKAWHVTLQRNLHALSVPEAEGSA